MQLKLDIKRLANGSINELLNVLHESFGTVAKEFNLTQNNNPTNGAFITKDQLIQKIEKGLIMFGYFQNGVLVGTVGIEQSKDPNVYYIEKLCVFPKYRHNGIGFDLLSYSENEVRKLNGKIVSIGIIHGSQ
jgi:ribosomal protein S18 acetylase RimI-like enzyme